MRRLLGSLIIAALPALAGQSAIFSSGVYAANYSVPNSGTAATTTEIQLSNWSGNGYAWQDRAYGTYAYISLSGSTYYLSVYDYHAAVPGGSPIGQVALPSNALTAYVRISQSVSAGTLSSTVEVWDYVGAAVGQVSSSNPYSATTDTGILIGNYSVRIGFYKVHSGAKAAGGRLPLTSDHASTLVDYKLDGDLSDSSPSLLCGGSACNMAATGAVTYQSTAYQGPTAVIKTFGAPSWTNWVTMRAGYPNQLDCTNSYSQADTSSSVTCAWSASGPSVLSFDSTSSNTPTVTNVVFGGYTFTLVVTDTGSQQATATERIGAVVMSANGVVANSASATAIFGPMIAWGRNPWGYSDYLAKLMSDERYKQYVGTYTGGGGPNFALSPTYPHSTWETQYSGTVSYKWGGLAMDTSSSGAGTYLTTAITGTGDGNFIVNDISKIDTSGLPGTPIRIYLSAGGANGWEEVRICSVSSSTLTSCTGGRGTLNATLGLLAAQTWPIGTWVGQFKVTGTSTSFLSTLCAPGTSPNRTAFLHFKRTDNSDAYVDFPIAGCESNTAAYVLPYLAPDIYGISHGQQISGVTYGYADNLTLYWNQSGTGGLNFYSEDLANLALYLRTGLPEYLERSEMISNIWAKFRGGVCQGSTLFCGGTYIGGVANAVLSTNPHKMDWPTLRGYAKQGLEMIMAMPPNASPGSCNLYDSRDTGYRLAFFSLAALFDPDTTSTGSPNGNPWSTYWRSYLSNMYAAENACRKSDDSWGNSGYRWGNQASITLSNGSAIGTGTGLPAGICHGTASGSGTATNGSSIVTGSGFTSGVRIAITGTKNSNPYTEWRYFTLNSSTQITIPYGVTWQGDSGSITWMIDDTEWPVVFGQSMDDTALAHSWSCIRNSSSQITLMRPWSTSWDGPAGTYGYYSYNVAGYAQQPYMLGIRMRAWRWASLAATAAGQAALAAQLNSLRYAADAWMFSTGMDFTIAGGPYYARLQEICEPVTAASMGNSVCFSGNPPNGAYNITASRELTQETSETLLAHCDSTTVCTSQAKTQGDTLYGNLWGVQGYTTGGVWINSDGNNEASANAAASFSYHQGKWFGFMFGVGMAHQWPAIRAASSPSFYSTGVGGGANVGGRVKINF